MGSPFSAFVYPVRLLVLVQTLVEGVVFVAPFTMGMISSMKVNFGFIISKTLYRSDKISSVVILDFPQDFLFLGCNPQLLGW